MKEKYYLDITNMIWLSMTLYLCLLGNIQGYTYHWGSCPRIEPVQNFQMDKFSGLWYVVQKVDTSSSCWTYNFLIKNGTMKVIQSRDQIVDVEDPEESKLYAGILEVPDPKIPAFMLVKFPDNIAGKTEYTVFATDYDNYGAIFACQKILFGRRQSISILSRKPYLQQMYTSRVRSKLISSGIDTSSLNVIDQTGCKHLPPTVTNISDWEDSLWSK